MPRDKTETHKRIVPAIKKAFLEKGYEKTTIRDIAHHAKLTTAGLYRHYANKEEMFEAMVKPAVDAFDKMVKTEMHETLERISDKEFLKEFTTFRKDKNLEFLQLLYQYFDEFRLLILSSKGTKYENFEDKVIECEVNGTYAVLKELKRRGLPCNEVKYEHMHIMATSEIVATLEILRHSWPYEEAKEYIEFIERLYYPGKKDILGF